VLYPQSDGRIERWQKSLKSECIRPTVSYAEVAEVYNTQRLHSAIGCTTLRDKLEGREAVVFAKRKRKLAEARGA